MKMFQTLRAKIVALLVASAVGGLALAASFPPGITTGQSLFPGFWSLIGASVDVSTDAPVATGSGDTFASYVGGANTGTFIVTGTAGAITLTFPDAMPNGRVCVLKDITTPADSPAQSAFTTTTAVFTGTVVTGDKLAYDCRGF
jgi:hypothetical protein